MEKTVISERLRLAGQYGRPTGFGRWRVGGSGGHPLANRRPFVSLMDLVDWRIFPAKKSNGIDSSMFSTCLTATWPTRDLRSQCSQQHDVLPRYHRRPSRLLHSFQKEWSRQISLIQNPSEHRIVAYSAEPGAASATCTQRRRPIWNGDLWWRSLEGSGVRDS